MGYRDVLRPSLLVGRYKTPSSDPSKLEARLVEVLGEPGVLRWGGAAAGTGSPDSIGARVRSCTTPRGRRRRSRSSPRWRSPDGDLIVLRLPGPAPMQGPQPTVVHPLLIVAELLAEPDERGWRATAEIRETQRS